MGGDNSGLRLALMALAWLCGTAWHLGLAELPPDAVHAACMAGGIAAVAVGIRWRRARASLLLGVALLAFGVAGQRASMLIGERLDGALEGVDLRVTGVVASLPQRSAGGQRFVFEVEEARAGERPVRIPPRLMVGWYAGFHDDTPWPQPLRELGAGQRWQLTLRLKQAHGLMNPHGFDQELHLFEQGIHATGSVRDAPGPRLLDRAAGHRVERWRQSVRDSIDLHVPDARAAGVLAALAIGDQSAIEREDWEIFRSTGIAHLVSISGLHVTMFAWLAGLAVSAAWRRSGRLVTRLPAVTAGRWCGLVAAVAYAVFSGWGIPSQRTVWMLGAIVVLQSLGRRWPWPLVLLFAAVVVTAVQPWALLQPGFWLSFMAVALLMASSEAHRQREPVDAGAAPTWRSRAARRLGGELRSQVVATLGLAPLSLVFFQQLSVVGLAANLLAIPLVTLVLTPLALLGAIASPLWVLGAGLVRALTGALAWFAAWPAAVWSAPVAPAWAQLAGLAGAVLLVAPVPWRLRLLAVPLVVPLLLPAVPRPADGEFELLAADVGQGTAVLVRTRHHLLLYDTGPQYANELDAGQRVLLPLLRARGEPAIDRLVLSHRDVDHVGGARSVLGGVAVRSSSTSIEDGHALRALLPAHTRCAMGQSWTWDGVHFEVLHPPSGAYADTRKPNGLSCVVKVSGAGGSALLAGDIERDQEAWLVAHDAQALRSDVLLVPHHGSKTSSTAAFLDAVGPRVAVFQAGYRNRFGHPAADVLVRYRERRIAAMDSASCGAWRWHSRDGPHLRLHGAQSPASPGQGVCQRDAARRYWHHGLWLPYEP